MERKRSRMEHNRCNEQQHAEFNIHKRRCIYVIFAADTRRVCRDSSSLLESIENNTHPSVVIVTMVYQKAAGIEVKLVTSTFFSA